MLYRCRGLVDPARLWKAGGCLRESGGPRICGPYMRGERQKSGICPALPMKTNS